MSQKRYKPEQIIIKLREAEVEVSKETLLDGPVEAGFYRKDILSLA